jgi:hypothetical protein
MSMSELYFPPCALCVNCIYKSQALLLYTYTMHSSRLRYLVRILMQSSSMPATRRVGRGCGEEPRLGDANPRGVVLKLAQQ